MAECRQCGRGLTADEIGLYRKTVHRGAETFLCITCLADYFRCEEELLRRKIEQFRESGCLLFEQKTE